MKLSVIIPVYNSQQTILSCLDSVYSQEIGEYNIEMEVIVIDDGSTDNSLILLEKYKVENKKSNLYIFHKKNGGVSSARNYGINIAKGEWIAFLDSDDIWLPAKIRKQFDIILSSNVRIDFLGCARNNEKLRILFRHINTLYKANVTDLLIKMFPQTSTAIVRKSVLDVAGNYNEKMRYAEDGELWVRICASSNFYYYPESLVITGNGKYNFGASGLSSNIKKMQAGTEEMLYLTYSNNIISQSQLYIFLFFYKIKYIRRMLIVMFRRG
ncbi:glycosyltransferase [Jinshanibacter sp. LJY008]|uniref:Glycosyltransferase n=1 Tax=Limnobaculum eriocheiris TaxID=2897391 RepID=A0A9X1SK14_9GAMM|nr:glycosyltransferase [Limnobaculum eriocheiris]MCD1124789.1 glycosyltransferase [Limnobaculum eriocheiris]